MSDRIVNVYDSTASSQVYSRNTGLKGRFDNVYRLWEDPSFREAIFNFFIKVFGNPNGSTSELRIMDLGCGSGKGLELLDSIRPSRSSLRHQESNHVFRIKKYTGTDLSPGMIDEAKKDYKNDSRTSFFVHDLNQGLPTNDGEGYNVYFSSYGTLSHLTDESLEKLIVDIFQRTEERSVLVMDVLGRFSPEWPEYGRGENASRSMHPYTMSHLKEGVASSEDFFPMRFWSGDELSEFVHTIASREGFRVVSRYLKDRSILTGRHMDTGSFFPKNPSIRRAVNMLFEPGIITPLESLIYPAELVWESYPEAFSRFVASWNTLVEEAARLCGETISESGSFLSDEHPAGAVYTGIAALQKISGNLDCYPCDDPRADFFEPALAHALRTLEREMNEGAGCGHSLLAFFEFARV